MDTRVINELVSLPATAAQRQAPPARPAGTVLTLFGADILAIFAAILVAGLLRDATVGNRAGIPGPPLLIGIVVFVASCFVMSGLYPGVTENPVQELRRCWLACSLGFLSLAASTFLSLDMKHSRLTFIFAWLWCLILVPLTRAAVRALCASLSWWGSPVVVLGAGKTGKLLLETLKRNPGVGLKPVALLDDNPQQYQGFESELRVGPIKSCLKIAREHRIPYCIICMPGLSRKELLHMMDSYGHCFRHVMVVPDLIGMACLEVSVREIGGVIGLEVAQNLLRPSAKFAKRALDLLLTLAVAPVVVPIVLLSALLVKLETRGPAFYGNERIGHNGQKFKAWKLRSMVVDNNEALRQYLESHPEERDHWNSTQKLKRDPRITRIGKIIRKTSIDELPQLWNVFIGEMSVVGPRPILEQQIEMYGPAFTLYQRVRPGITGLWQISGRNHLPFKERVRMDAYTIQNWSVWLDIYILSRTVTVVLTAKGAY